MNRSRLIAGLLLVSVGVLLALDAAGFVVPDIWELLWPLLLVGAGLWILLSSGRRRSGRAVWAPTPSAPVRTAEQSVQVTALFSGRNLSTAADPFLGGVAVALFGSVELDLRAARLPQEGTVLDASAIFGGVTVIIPPGWNVAMSGPAIFGGIDDRSEAFGPPPPDAPQLMVRALAIFGGVEVKVGAAVAAPELVDA